MKKKGKGRQAKSNEDKNLAMNIHNQVFNFQKQGDFVL